MSDAMKDFHHYKGNSLSSVEKVEQKVVELLSFSKIPDSARESSTAWELKHSSGCAQIGKMLAQKRGLNADLAVVACVLHDIYVIVEGKYKDHAKLGASIAEKILDKVGGFSKDQVDTITQAVLHHSEKEIISDNPYAELVKDADVFDCSLYKGSENYYKLHKSEHIFIEYVKRIKKVREELSLPATPVFYD